MAMVLRNRKRPRGALSEKEVPVVCKKRVAKKNVSNFKMDSPFTDKEHFVRICMKLQGEGAMPFDFWDSDVAGMVFGPHEKAFNVSVKAKDMEIRLRSECSAAFEELKTKLRGKMFFVRLETIPKNSDFISASVQFMENFEVKIAHLGRLDTRSAYKRRKCSNYECYEGRPCWEDMSKPYYCDELNDLFKVVGLYRHQIYCTILFQDFSSDFDWNEDGCPLPTHSNPAVDEINFGMSLCLQPYYKDLAMLENLDFGSTFTKLSELKQKKCDGETKLKPEQLILVKKLWRALKPAQEMMEKETKSKQYTCGDLWLDLLGCETELKKQGDEFSMVLWEAMKERRATLLKNIQIRAALYLDPRLNNCNMALLTGAQKRRVLLYLDQVYNEIEKVEQRSADGYDRKCRFEWDREPDWENYREWNDDYDEYEEDDEVEEDDGDNSADSDRDLTNESNVLRNALKKLESQPEPRPGLDIVEYWQEKKDVKLKKLANVVLAYPVSDPVPMRGDFTFDPKILTSNDEGDLKNLMKMHLGYTADM